MCYSVFAHCFTCTKNLKAINNICLSLTKTRIAVLRFDFTGLGESEGEFADTNFSSNVGDLVAAAAFLQAHYETPRVLIGHSLGGTAVIQAAKLIPSAVAIATIAAPFQPAYLAKLLVQNRDEIERSGEAEVVIGGGRFKISKQFIEDLERTDMKKTIADLQRALLICHSPLDATVSIDNAAEIFVTAKHPKSFLSLNTADHLLTDARDSAYVGTMVATWASRYIQDDI